MPVQKKERMDILGKKLVLKDLLSYQDSAIVSRTLIDKKAGTVTLFAFDEGQGLSEHAAPYDAMVEVLDGEVEISIDRAPHQLRAGDMIVMPANHPHAVRALTPFKMLLTMIRSEDTQPSVVAIS
ncbi:MAG TPA: cupin domain-containing protein [Methanomassiliicoccales archaeon]|nr:cupin domain-containing protein [Methanomassiliicoccales archaeon]